MVMHPELNKLPKLTDEKQKSDFANLSVLIQQFRKELYQNCDTAIETLQQSEKNTVKHNVFEQNLPQLTGQAPTPEPDNNFVQNALLQNALVEEMFKKLYVSDNADPLMAYLAHIEQQTTGVDTAQALANAKATIAALQTPEAELAFSQLKTETALAAEQAAISPALPASSNGAQPPQDPTASPENKLDDEAFVESCKSKETPLTPLQQKRLQKINANHKIYAMRVDANGNRHLYKDVQSGLSGFEDNQDMLQNQAQKKVTAAVGAKMQQDTSPTMRDKKELIETVVGNAFRFESSLTRHDVKGPDLKAQGLDDKNLAKLVTTGPKLAAAA